MKKIGILTFHYADNYGAVLQAYALRKVIDALPGCEAEIINYVPEGYEYFFNPDTEDPEKYISKRKKFERFLTEECGIRSAMIHSLNECGYDYYCVGSDQVWNMDLPEAKGLAYFLPNFNDGTVRFSYAASIGMDAGRIDRSIFQKYVSKFYCVGLREQSYLETVSGIIHKECVHNIDPTLLLTKEDYEKLIDSYGEEEDFPTNQPPYILYFLYNGADGRNTGFRSIEIVNALSRKYGLTVLHTFPSEQNPVRQMLCRDGGCIYEKGIEEFLWYVKHADFVVTDSFHVSIFSILFERSFYMFLCEGKESRQEDLASMLGLSSRIIREYRKPEMLNGQIEYASSRSILEKERKMSINYLKETLSVPLG